MFTYKNKLIIQTFIIDQNNFKRPEFLDLDYKFKDRNIISLDNYKFISHFDKRFKHLLHEENQQLNSITDLIINLGTNLKRCDKSTVKTL